MTKSKKILTNLAKIILFVGVIVLAALSLNYGRQILPFAKNINRLVSEGFTVFIILAAYYLFMAVWNGTPLSKLDIVPNRRRLILLGGGALIGSVLLIAVLFIIKSLGAISISTLGNTTAGGISIVFVTMLFAAIWEETAFRGCVLQILSETIGVHQSCIVVALCFGLLHLLSPLSSLQIVISTFMSGMLLNYSYFYAGNLYLPIGVHFGWNFLNSLFFSSGFYKVEYLNSTLAGIKNPEQGIIAIVMTGLSAVCFAVLYMIRKRRMKLIAEV